MMSEETRKAVKKIPKVLKKLKKDLKKMTKENKKAIILGELDDKNK